MVYFRIEMGLGHSPKKKECSATNAIHVQFHGYGNAVCRHCLSEMATDTRRRAALCPV